MNDEQNPSLDVETPEAGRTGEAPDPEAGSSAGTPEPDAAGNAEAAKWRRRLREEEVKTAALTGRVDGYERAEVERRLADRLEVPGDAWLDPAFTLDAMRDEEGRIDEARVEAEIERLVNDRPTWVKTARPNLHQGVRDEAPAKGPSFGEFVKKARGG